MKLMLTNNQKGATVVEFAIILPLLILLIFALIEFSLILYDKGMLTNASREGARAGVLFASPNRISSTDIENVVDNYCKKNLVSFGASGYDITVDPPTDPACVQGEFITVSIDYVYDFLFLPFGTIPLDVQTVMRCE